MFERLISLIAPHICMACGQEGTLVCAWCKPDAFDPIPERCYHCKVVSRDSAVCSKCRPASPLKYVWIHTVYKDIAKELIHDLKFARAKAAAKLAADLLHESIPALSPETVVTYIPTATSRVRQRGYDQTQLIAKAIAKQRGLPCRTLLIRHGQARQVGADRKHRITQASNNYSATHQKHIQKATILLIDDILTTGATIESAAKILKKAGAKQINAAIFAQKQ